MPEGEPRALWSSLPDSADFKSGDEIYSLCHNCNNIIEEMHPGTKVRSLWKKDSQQNHCFSDWTPLRSIWSGIRMQS